MYIDPAEDEEKEAERSSRHSRMEDRGYIYCGDGGNAGFFERSQPRDPQGIPTGFSAIRFRLRIPRIRKFGVIHAEVLN
jgi:hypothetical protein